LVANGIGGRESILRSSISDAGNDTFGIGNGTNRTARFSPTFYGYVDSHNTFTSMAFRGLVAPGDDVSDSGAVGLISFEAVRTDNSSDPVNGALSAVENRKLFTFSGFGVRYMTIAANGKVGIGITSPDAKLQVAGDVKIGTFVSAPDAVNTTLLNVNGVVELGGIANAIGEPSGTASTGKVYAWEDEVTTDTVNVFAMDSIGNSTRLTSHKDPRELDPLAITSFSDTSISMPFSTTSHNIYIGKGTVVDITKMAKLLEQLTGEKLVWEYETEKQDIKVLYSEQYENEMWSKINFSLDDDITTETVGMKDFKPSPLPQFLVERLPQEDLPENFVYVEDENPDWTTRLRKPRPPSEENDIGIEDGGTTATVNTKDCKPTIPQSIMKRLSQKDPPDTLILPTVQTSGGGINSGLATRGDVIIKDRGGRI
jgi:hypothetical protein